MKKLISIVFYLLLLLIVFLGSAYAQESASGQGVKLHRLTPVASSDSVFRCGAKPCTECHSSPLLRTGHSGTWVSEEESMEEEVIKEEDIDKLMIDESKEPPAEKIVPIPTPMPQKEENKQEEKKAWEEFKYNSIIQKVSERYNIDPQLIYATIMTESEGDEYAFRYEPYIQDASLCMGQILISTARSLGFSGNPLEMYKPDVCIELIGKYHRKMLDEYGELTPLQLAAAYNTGSPWGWPVPGHLFRFEKWFYETVKG